jgi:5,10-methylene-tetrahydrofolate dehydrogenase/methenyl tetrahydrofolate cyclohydrolase
MGRNDFVKDGVLDGKAVAEHMRSEIASEVQQLKEKYGKVRRGAYVQDHCDASSVCALVL